MIGFDADNRTDGMIWLDDETDLTDLPDKAREKQTPMGTKAYVIDTGDVYIQKSDFSFKKQ